MLVSSDDRIIRTIATWTVQYNQQHQLICIQSNSAVVYTDFDCLINPII